MTGTLNEEKEETIEFSINIEFIVDRDVPKIRNELRKFCDKYFLELIEKKSVRYLRLIKPKDE